MYFPKTIEPNIVQRIFRDKQKECILVKIESEEYTECELASHNFWGNSKPGAYGAGLGAEANDKHKPARTGLLGQMAFGKLTGLPVDTEYRRGGDRQDNLIGKYKTDIKCAMQSSSIDNPGVNLIYHTNEWGRKIPLDKDIYVCSYIEQENRNEKTATVIVTGFALNEDVKNCPIQRGRKGNGHRNYVISAHKTRPIVPFIEATKKYTTSFQSSKSCHLE